MATVIAVTVDLHPNTDTHTQTIEFPSDIKWPDFELMLRLAYDLDSVVIKYVDEDNDQVTISSDEELREAFRVAHSQLDTLQLKLFCPPPYTVINAPRPEPAPRRPAHPGIAKPVTAISNDIKACAVPDDAPTTSSSGSSSDESFAMEGVESNKDTVSSPDSPPAASAPRYFYMRHSNTGKVLDVEGWGRCPGTRVLLWEKKHGTGHYVTNYSCENQLFLQHHETGTIRSYFCGLCVDATENGLTMQLYNPDKQTQKWQVSGDRIQNGSNNYNWVLGVTDTTPTAMIYEGTPNQQWELEYVDEGVGLASGVRPCGSRGHHLYKELAEEMARQMSNVSEDNPIPEGVPPAWFNAYMDKFKRDVCEEISTLVTRKTVRQVLAALHQHPTATAASGAGPSTHGQQTSTAVNHYGIVCDSCDMPITGVRYKCGNCEDFDLCEGCEATMMETKLHDQNHVFIKLRRPANAIIRRKTGRQAPLLKRPLYPTEQDIMRLEEKILRKHERHRRRGEKHEEKQKRREEKLKRRHEVHRDTPSKKEKLDMPHVKGCERMDAEFVEDENFPDGSRVEPDRSITKRWVMKNTGLFSWDSNTKLSLMWGNIPVVASEVEVAPTGPNEKCTVSVQLVTPSEPGVYQSHWRMSHKNARFGHRVWCSIIVVRPQQDGEAADKSDTVQHPPAMVVCDEAPTAVVLLPEIKTDPEVAEPQVTEPVGTEPKVTEPKETEREVTEEAVRRDQEEDDELMVESMMAHTSTAPPKEDKSAAPAKEQKSAAEVDLLSAQDILSFEMLDIRDRNTPKVSQTATPTNTPMAMTPPKSPTRELEEGAERHLSTSSSVEVVSESSEESTSHMTELVQERIAKLGLRQDHFEDLETISTCSEDSNDDSESDFYIVPLPDCFNPSRPLSASTTNIVLTREEVQKTVDDILTASKSLDAPSLVPDTLSADDKNSMEVVDMTKEDTLDDVSLLAFEMPPTDSVKEAAGAESAAAADAPMVVPEVAVVTEQAAAPQGSDHDTPVEILTDENANSVPTTPESSTDTLTLHAAAAAPAPGVAVVDLTQEEEGATAANPITLDADRQEEDKDEKVAERPSTGSIPIKQRTPTSSQPGTPPSPTVLASSLMTAALGVASQAATTAYTTVKDVFHTMQANNQYVPPKSTWKPPQQKWTPPKQDFTLPKETWSPPQEAWTPPQEAWTPPQETWTPPQPAPLPPSVVEAEEVAPPAAPSSAMQQLVEMGFANRQLNQQLLHKHAQDVQKVVLELVSSEDNDWHQGRH